MNEEGITQARKEELIKTIKGVITHGGFEGDRTDGQFKPVGEGSPWHLVIFRGQLSSVKMDAVTPLNPIELHEGIPTLSRWSFGAIVDLRDGKTLQEGVETYLGEGDWNSPARKKHIEIVDLSLYK